MVRLDGEPGADSPAEQLLRTILDSTDSPVFSVDRGYRYTSYNAAHAGVMRALYGADIAVGESLLDYLTVAEDRAGARENLERALAGEHPVASAYSGSGEAKRHFRIVHSPVYGDRGEVVGVVVAAHDDTASHLVDETLHRVQRELRAISSCNQVLMRAADEQALLDDICRIICDEAGYKLAWVGYAEHDADKSIRPVAWAGSDHDYVTGAHLSWSEEVERGRGPSGTAVRTGEVVYSTDLATDARMEPWRDNALARGFRCSIALPLKDEGGRAFGVLSIYSGSPEALRPAEIRLLEDLAADLAFGIGVAREREEKKRAERSLALTSFALDNVHEAAYLIDETARIVYANEEGCRALGYQRGELVGLRVTDVDPDFPPERWPEHWRELKERASLTFEGRHRTKDGRDLPVEINANFFEYDGVDYNLALVRDIAARKQAEQERVEHVRLFEHLDRVNRAIQGARDADAMMEAVLDVVLDVFGCERAGLIYPCDPSASSWQIMRERTRADWPGLLPVATAVPMDPVVADFFRRMREADGPVGLGPAYGDPVPQSVEGLGYKSHLATVLYPKVGLPWGFSLHQCSYERTWTPAEIRLLQEVGRRLGDGLTSLLTLRDLARREAELNESQRVAHIGSWDWDAVRDTIWWSDEYYRIYGFAVGSPTPNYVEHLQAYTEESAARLDAAVKRSMATGEPYELDLEFAHPTSATRWIVARGEAKRDADGKICGLRGTAQNITERKATEAALVERQSFIRNILESVDEGFIVVDRAYQVVSANRAFCASVGTTEAEAVGRPCYTLAHHADKPCYEAGVDCPVKRTFATGFAATAEHEHVDDAGIRHQLEIRSYPIVDATGHVVSAIETINDVTDRRGLEEQLRQAQKMEAVGTLAGGVAHDFNNILTAIMGYASIVKMHMRPDDPQRASVDQIVASSQRAAHLTQGLLAFSRRRVINPKPIDVDDIVRSVEHLLERLIGEDVDLSIHHANRALIAMADAGQIEQVLMNLATNARDAMPDGGALSIAAEQRILDEELVHTNGVIRPGRYAVLSVADTGVGMDDDIREKIFEPFFTTKELGKGTGLGLAIVYGIVAQHDGSIRVRSRIGEGTTFEIYLPLVASAVEEAPPEKFVLPRGGTETILLAEDDPYVRALSRTVLREFGYTVIEAVDGQDTVEQFTAQPEAIDLLVLDVIMPKMSGKEVYDAIKAIRPNVEVLFISGYTDDIIHKKGIFDAGLNFIAKPVSPQELLRKIRELLDESPVAAPEVASPG